MKRACCIVSAGVLALLIAYPVPSARGEKKDRVRYEKYKPDSVLKEMREEKDSLQALNDSITAEINKKFKGIKKQKREDRKVIRFDFSNIKKPGSPGVFEAPFHYPPVAQYMTSACWCYCTTSFIESEVKRLSGREIKLSEMYTVYWEFVEKAIGFVQKRGNQIFPAGSESDAVLIVWNKYGIVPAEAYSGLLEGRELHDHSKMTAEMRNYLEFVRKHDYWDEIAVTAQIREILDRYLGRPPESFEYGGKRYTPTEFFDEVVRLDTSEYVQLMSTLAEPFYTRGRFDVPDNWRPTSTYYNVPLDDFMDCIERACKGGHTVAIGGDVSEPGYFGMEDAAVVPSFDIPQNFIDQDSREFRFFNRTTEDDHGVHLLALEKTGGRNWFLIKDSITSSSRC